MIQLLLGFAMGFIFGFLTCCVLIYIFMRESGIKLDLRKN
jgi:hypothetical protein